MQNQKVPTPAAEATMAEAITYDNVERMETDCLYILGPGTTAETSDVISVALDLAKSSGLMDDPDEMYISKGVYSEFMPPGTLESSYADHTVWVVWLKSDIGKFPIPKFASSAGAEVLPLKPTATPAK